MRIAGSIRVEPGMSFDGVIVADIRITFGLVGFDIIFLTLGLAWTRP
jgi:hypothetical protein